MQMLKMFNITGRRNRTIVYALLTGAAVLVGTMLYLHWSAEPMGSMDGDIEEIGPIRRDENGHIEFE